MSSQEQTNHPSTAKDSSGMNPNHRATPSAHAPQNGGPIEPKLPLYWSVLHHRNVNDGASNNAALQNGTEPHAAHGNIPEVIHERQPFISEGSTQSALTGYDSTTGSPRVSPLTLPQKQQSSESENAKRSKWGRVREAVDSKELFIKYLAEEGNTSGQSTRKWSDLANITHELSLRECFILFLALLAVGAIAYSYVFEQWPILDSLYFTTVLLTTVGYGDLTPTTPSGKMFASVFALGGIVLLGLALGVIGSALVEAEINYTEKVKSKATTTLEKAFTRRSHRGQVGAQRIENIEALERDRSLPRTYSTDSLDSIGSESTTCSSVYGPDSPTHSLSSKRGHRSFREKERKHCCPGLSVVQRYLPGFAPLLIGGLIMGLIEHWYWDDAIYYCVVTATTVGFGDFHPNTDTAKLCAILFIPIVVAATGYILGNLASFIIEQRRAKYDQRLWSSELKIEDIDALDEARDGGVSELEYIKFMLVAMKKIDAGLFDELRDQFEKLDPTGDGKITKKDLSIMATRRLRKVSHKLKLREYKKRLTGRHHGSIRESGFVQAVMAR